MQGNTTPRLPEVSDQRVSMIPYIERGSGKTAEKSNHPDDDKLMKKPEPRYIPDITAGNSTVEDSLIEEVEHDIRRIEGIVFECSVNSLESRYNKEY